MNTFRAVAHRGYPVRYPENTLSSFEAALQLNYAYLELDVQLSKDGVPVVIHDYTVDRVTDGTGAVKDFTLQELKRLKVHGKEEIPTLREALELAKGRAIVSVELKQAGDLYPGLEEKTLRVIEELGMREHVYLLSFDHYSITRVRELDWHIPAGITISAASPFLFEAIKAWNLQYFAAPTRYITPAFVQRAEEAGVQLIVWPADTLAEMEKLRAYPSLLATTNELEKWQHYCAEHGMNQATMISG
ncbi:glycerophosphodiester phosphodiesterase [Paenibacillus sp.]|uniref:glycerophosphodiester phosphodiesterase n=1 Tax=Paenibacillus sp. TaxID=58172 RepID=UPI002D301F7D|nr:glycerophosphodiester phosphodiesterase family protein [Paenibacillus sp.]HZG83415.1 glycerophosphodiester phosphodiesterase family protein [Paenibacillus sp.]